MFFKIIFLAGYLSHSDDPDGQRSLQNRTFPKEHLYWLKYFGNQIRTKVAEAEDEYVKKKQKKKRKETKKAKKKRTTEDVRCQRKVQNRNICIG